MHHRYFRILKLQYQIFHYSYRMTKIVKLHTAAKSLVVKRSGLPGAGKGLFTRQPIKKGSIVVEYKGKLTTWKTITGNEIFNGYVFYINRNNVVDAKKSYRALGRYANDARGLGRVHGLINNARYITKGTKVFIEATRNIAAGSEILVGYGKEYWDVIKHNHKS